MFSAQKCFPHQLDTHFVIDGQHLLQPRDELAGVALIFLTTRLPRLALLQAVTDRQAGSATG